MKEIIEQLTEKEWFFQSNEHNNKYFYMEQINNYWFVVTVKIPYKVTKMMVNLYVIKSPNNAGNAIQIYSFRKKPHSFPHYILYEENMGSSIYFYPYKPIHVQNKQMFIIAKTVLLSQLNNIKNFIKKEVGI